MKRIAVLHRFGHELADQGQASLCSPLSAEKRRFEYPPLQRGVSSNRRFSEDGRHMDQVEAEIYARIENARGIYGGKPLDKRKMLTGEHPIRVGR